MLNKKTEINFLINDKSCEVFNTITQHYLFNKTKLFILILGKSLLFIFSSNPLILEISN